MKKRVKGFTLMELIVVLAIFSVVMAAAMQLLQPVTKSMVLADVTESGNAAVANISAYLENQISAAEYLDAYNSLPSGAAGDTMDDRVKNYVQYYYEGVLRKGSGTDDPAYAKGTFHVLTVDNNNGGKISRYTYTAQFNINDFKVTRDTALDEEWAVNKSYYDDFSFAINFGTYPDSGTVIESDLTTNYELSAQSTAYSIRATTERNHKEYSFRTNNAMSLTNIYNRSGKPVNSYYIIEQTFTSSATNPETRAIVSIAKEGQRKYDALKYTLARKFGAISRSAKAYYKQRYTGLGTDTVTDTYTGVEYYKDTVTGSETYGKLLDSSGNEFSEGPDNYCFIYSYGSEINVN